MNAPGDFQWCSVPIATKLPYHYIGAESPQPSQGLRISAAADAPDPFQRKIVKDDRRKYRLHVGFRRVNTRKPDQPLPLYWQEPNKVSFNSRFVD